MTSQASGTESDTRWLYAATIFARIALAAAFLSAVADRFGLWGSPGTGDVFWGNFGNFTEYVGVLAPYLPVALLTPTAWVVTVAEITVAVALLSGIALRWTALASAVMLTVFGMSMFIFDGFETPLSASVFTAAAAALLLAAVSRP